MRNAADYADSCLEPKASGGSVAATPHKFTQLRRAMVMTSLRMYPKHGRKHTRVLGAASLRRRRKTMTEELLPCPFCGSTELGIEYRYHIWVRCKEEACVSDGPMRLNKLDAIKAWNQRAKPKAIKDLGTIEFADGMDD